MRGEVTVIEARFTAKSGAIRWLSVSCRPVVQDGRVVGAQGVAADVTDRREAEAAFQESERRYRELVESLRDVVYVVDDRGRLQFLSAAVTGVLGYDPSELTGRPFAEFLHEEDRRRALAMLKEALATGEARSAELRARAKSGEVLWFHATGRVMRRRDGGTEIRGMITDITDLKRAEEALRESRERLQYIIDNTEDIIFEIDLAGNYTFGNKAAERVTGYPLDRLLRMNMAELVVPEYRQGVFDRLRRRIGGEALPQPFRFEIDSRHGRRVALELTTTGVYRDGKPLAVQGIARDVTERERAERALRESEERLRAIVSSLHETIILLYGPEGTILDIWAPAAMEERYQLRADEMRGRRIEELLPAPLARERLARIREVFRGRGAARDEYRLTIRGRELWAEVGYSPMLDAFGEVGAVVGFLRDVSERKQAEEELRLAQSKLTRARWEERRRLAAELHDSIGQKVIALQLYIQKTVSGARDGMTAAQLDECGRGTAAKCGELVREVRQICYGLHPPTLASLGLVAALRQLVQSSCHDPGIACRIRTCKELENRRLGEDVEVALFRIAQEAVTNALRHSGARRLDLELRCDAGRVAMAITDDGKGFDVDASRALGLGLTSMGVRAQGIGAELRITSSPKGTRVSVIAAADLRE